MMTMVGRSAACAMMWALVSGSFAQAEPNFLQTETGFDGMFPAVAVIGVDTPTSFSSATGQFTGFDGVADYTFTVIGDVRILSSVALNSFNDLITGNPVGPVGAGTNDLTVQQEIVDISVGSINSTASINSLRLGDTVADQADSGVIGAEPRSFFSTGGAAQTSDGALTAEGFLNLFLEVEVTSPDIPGLGVAPGFLHNQTELHLEATIDDYLPFGTTFNMVGGPVDLFTRGSGSSINTALEGLFGAGTFPDPIVAARFVSAQITITPEPTSFVMGAFALGGLLSLSRRRRRRAA